MNLRRSISTILLAALWLLAAVSAIARAATAAQNWDFVTGLASFLFIAALIWQLARSAPAFVQPSEPSGAGRARPGFWTRLLLIWLGLALVFFLGLMAGTGFVFLLTCGLAGLGVTLAWRRDLTKNVVWGGLALGMICAAGIAWLGNGDLGWAAANLLALPPAFTGGVLLLQYSRLGQVSTLQGQPWLGLRSFALGCLLALPAALLNNLGELHSQDAWLVHNWQVAYAIVPALAEEAWARLLLVPLCYALLRAAAPQRPRLALWMALLASVFAHGYAHTGIDPFGILIGSLLYSLPAGLLLVRRDFESAVGYHFLVDFARYLAALATGA